MARISPRLKSSASPIADPACAFAHVRPPASPVDFFIENEIGGERTMMNDDFGIEGTMAKVMAISLGVISWGLLLYLPFQTSVA